MMLAVLIGVLSILVGILTLLLPLFLTELSRARDSFWGAIIIVLGLTVITMSHRFAGSSVLVLLLGLCVCARLIMEVGQHRWQLLTPEEKNAFKTFGRWDKGIRELFLTFRKLVSVLFELIQTFKLSKDSSVTGKKWVRADSLSEKKSEKALELNSKSSQKIEIPSESDQNSLLSKKNLTSEDS